MVYLLGYTFPAGDPNQCAQAGCTVSSNVTVLINPFEKENDGVVLAESASAYPDAYLMRCPGSNHQQIRNDQNTKWSLLDVWEGRAHWFFKTDPR